MIDKVDQINDMRAFLTYKQTWLFHKFVHCESRVIGLFCGNQAFKTSASAYQTVMRVLGVHPVPHNNVLYFECESRACPNGHRVLNPPEDMQCQECERKLGKFSSHKFTINTVPKDGNCPTCKTKVYEHERKSRIIRLASETLPNEKENTGVDGQSAEIRNALYPEIKKWLPKFLIKRDITFRNTSMALTDPHGRGDIILEFVSYSQGAQAGAGVQRLAIVCDEEPSIEFWHEQKPRLIAENGDLCIGLTPANQMTWTYDEVFEKADTIYRTPIMAELLDRPQVEQMNTGQSISVFQAATDDNPTLDEETIIRMYDTYDDPDVIATRRYGIFKQSSGRIFNFDYKVHFIDPNVYFPDGMYHDWVHGRFCDYHEVTPWAVSFMAISPQNEVFVYDEYNPSPESNVTLQITREIAKQSLDFKYKINLMDPLGTKTQTNTGVSVMDDFNDHFSMYRKEGLGTGGYWESWDTRSTKGRDSIRERLGNARKCAKPFNNMVYRDGLKTYLPTLWVLNNCRVTARSVKNWRKDNKDKPEQKHSHFCTAMEAAFKDVRFKAKASSYQAATPPRRKRYLFQGAL